MIEFYDAPFKALQNTLREGLKKLFFWGGTNPPTPGFLWDLGKREVKFGSKNAFSGGDFGRF